MGAGAGTLPTSNRATARGGDGQRAAARLAGPLSAQWRLSAVVSDVRLDPVDSVADRRITEIEEGEAELQRLDDHLLQLTEQLMALAEDPAEVEHHDIFAPA